MSEGLAYAAAALTFLWGIAHALPTRRVVAGFGNISADNRRVLTQEWIAEALTMWFIAAVVVVATATRAEGGPSADWVCRASAVMLLAVAGLTAVTGARTAVVWFKVCPVLLTTAAILLAVASFV